MSNGMKNAMLMEGPWRAAVNTTTRMGSHTFGAAVDAAVAGEAMRMVQFVHEGFKVQGLRRPWRELSPITMQIRKKLMGFGGSKKLMVSGSLRRSVEAKRVEPHKWFVGVHRSARGEGGRKLVNIAAVHEGPYPTLVPITQKMRRFFMALFLKGVIRAPLKKNRKILVIMPRPFLKPAFDKVKEGSQARIMAKIRSFIKRESLRGGIG